MTINDNDDDNDNDNVTGDNHSTKRSQKSQCSICLNRNQPKESHCSVYESEICPGIAVEYSGTSVELMETIIRHNQVTTTICVFFSLRSARSSLTKARPLPDFRSSRCGENTSPASRPYGAQYPAPLLSAEQSPCLLLQSSSLRSKSPFLHVKSPFLLVKSPFFQWFSQSNDKFPMVSLLNRHFSYGFPMVFWFSHA